MEKELESKIFMIDDYENKSIMEEQIKAYIKKLKNEYPTSIVTREFYKVENVLVRATYVEIPNKENKNKDKTKEKEIDDWYIRQRE